MTVAELRNLEVAKYQRTYEEPNYRIHGTRREFAIQDLRDLPCRGSYLDVSCGRGELLAEAFAMGYGPVTGTEVVPALMDNGMVYAYAHALPFPDRSIDVVSLFDVIEHLIPGDDEAACRELDRVARKHILITANDRDSRNHLGEILHINIRSHREWDCLFRSWFTGTVTWLSHGTDYASQRWRIDR